MSEESYQGECNNPNCLQALLVSRKAENTHQLRYHVIAVLSLLGLSLFTLGTIAVSSDFTKVVIIGVYGLEIIAVAYLIIACVSVLLRRDCIETQLEHLKWAQAAMSTA